MGVCQEIMALPEKERLPYAIRLLEELTGSKVEKQLWLREKFGLTMKEANIFLLLNANAPRAVNREVIHASVWSGSDTDIKIVDVLVCKIRKKGLWINTHWGVGFSVSEKMVIGESQKPEELNQSTRWTADNDNDLITMVKSGSGLRAIAYELERTERAVRERIVRLKSDGKM